MPPKVKVTKEDIISTAVDIVKNNGLQAVNARTIASILKCSTQPVFSNFAKMEDLRFAIIDRADILFKKYIQNEVEKGKYPVYKATGMAYIRFASEHKELFKLLYMRDRQSEDIEDEKGLNYEIETIVKSNTGLSTDDAKLFHLEMWAYVHGIATMFATGFLSLEWELVSKMLTDSYQGLRKQYGLE